MLEVVAEEVEMMTQPQLLEQAVRVAAGTEQELEMVMLVPQILEEVEGQALMMERKMAAAQAVQA